MNKLQKQKDYLELLDYPLMKLRQIIKWFNDSEITITEVDELINFIKRNDERNI